MTKRATLALLVALLLLAIVPTPVSTDEALAASDPIVTFNTKTLKYHCPTCASAKRCTKNCIDIHLSEAKKRDGVPCKNCGGTC